MATTTQLAFSENQQTGKYEAEHQVSSSFAIHVESAKIGAFTVEQKSDPAAPRFANTDVFSPKDVIDVQYHLELPALVKITSTTPVTYGTIIEA